MELGLRVWQAGDMPLAFTPLWAPPVTEESLCDVCDCTTDPSLPRLPDSQRAPTPLTSPTQLSGFVHSTLLNTFCNGVYMLPNYTESINHPPTIRWNAAAQVHRARERPESIFSWDLRGLKLGVPTEYIFTKTSMQARTAVKRTRYLARASTLMSPLELPST
jgi:hypothetical protein